MDMPPPNRPPHGALPLGAVAAEREQAALLQSVVDVARAIVAARAASIFLHDEEADELVFAAVSGEGEDWLVGRRFPADTGVAGWTLMTGQPLLLDDVREDPRFASSAAEATGYVPSRLMAAPLLHDESPLGVIEVLDWSPRPGLELAELELLALFAHQASIAVSATRAAHRARLASVSTDPEYAAVVRVAAALDRLSGPARGKGVRLLDALGEVLTA